MTHDFVSVTVCVRNGAQWVDQCLEALTQQTYESFEVIVVDDGSTDQTSSVLKKWDDSNGVRGAPVHILRQDAKGLSAARQYALQHAKGSWIAITDIDVRPEPNWISQMMKAYNDSSDEEHIVALTGRTMFGYESDPVSLLRAMEIDRKYSSRSRYSTLANGPCSMFKREKLEEIGGFDPDWFHAEDMEVSLKLILSGGNILYVADAIVHHVPETGLKRFLSKRLRDARAHVRIMRQYPRRNRINISFDFLGSSVPVLITSMCMYAVITMLSLFFLRGRAEFDFSIQSSFSHPFMIIILCLFITTEFFLWSGPLGSVHIQSLKKSKRSRLMTSMSIRCIVLCWGTALILGVFFGYSDALFAKNGHRRLFSRQS